ncbi:ribosomal RNA-processing protein RRP9 [Sporobolomyces salmoneus]|uniref:ribosomal RNA-processing protein RRP9 n=1 Tax=Sporobolomyces salmoneus TaxID=183962 RepID=UPI00316E2E8A
MPDAFFSKPRPFSKRKREGEGEGAQRTGKPANRNGSSSRGARGGGNTRGRGRGNGRRDGGGDRNDQKGKRRQEDDDEELDLPDDGAFDSDDMGSQADGAAAEESSEEEDELETPAQKRLRLSQMYLKSLEKDKEEEIGFDAADLDRDIIAERLQQDVLEHTGKLHLNVASSLQLPLSPSSIFHTPSKGHRGSVTSAVASHDGHWLFTSSKGGGIIKYSLKSVSSSSPSTSTQSPARITRAARVVKALSDSEKRDASKVKKGDKGKGKELVEGHSDEILDLAISHDGKVLASAGKDKVLGCWNIEGDGIKWARGLAGHKDKLASIAFRLGTQQLYTSSFDRTVKLFDLSTFSYVETLFGHQDCIQAVDALRGELAVTAGGRDKTVRYWKVMEESQLVFRGGGGSRIRNVLEGADEEEGLEEEERRRRRKIRELEAAKGPVKFVEGSIDCVAMVDDTTILSGGDSGSICLWTITKKKPIHTVQFAHGFNEHVSETEGIIGTPRWITSLATLPYGDVFASGSWDGQIRLWKIDERIRSFSLLTTIAAPGFVNSLQIIAPSLRPTKENHLPRLDGKKKERESDGEKEAKNLIVVAGVAKEPRLGRWMKFKDGKEGAVVAVIPMQ